MLDLRRRDKFRRWIYTWMPVHLLLIALGVANIFPFFWMVGDSLKSKSEAQANRLAPVPEVKYRLTDAGRSALPAPDALDEAQLRLLTRLRHDASLAGSITVDRYATDLGGIPVENAARQLDSLLSSGWLDKIDGAYRLSEKAASQIPPQANPRQAWMLYTLREEDKRAAGASRTYVQYAMTVGEYARKHGPEAAALADDEIRQLVDLNWLEPVWLQARNYKIVWDDMHFYLHFATSIVLTSAVVTFTVMMTSMLGYALARLRFPGKMLVLALMIAGTVAPREAVIIPIFQMLRSLGTLDGLWGMALWLTGAGIGNTFLMAGFFLTLPKEVEEAAWMDGAGTFRTYFDVALPMARPIVLTVALFTFLTAWNDFLIPLLCTQSNPHMQPLAVAVYSFQRGQQGLWHLINAAAAIMIVPVILLFIALQKYVVRSIAVGAVKG